MSSPRKKRATQRSRPRRRCGRDRRDAARAVAVGAVPRGCGGDRTERRSLAPPSRRQPARSAAPCRGSAARGRRRLAGRERGLQLLLRQFEHLEHFALPIVETLAAWPATATWGEWLDAFERLVPRVLRDAGVGASRPGGSASHGRRRTDRPGRSAARAGRSSADGRIAASGAALRRRVRRHAAAGARPVVPRRVRARTGRTHVSAEAARGSAAARRAAPCARRGAGDAAAAQRRRAAAAAAGDRRGVRTAVRVLSRVSS